MFYFDFGLINPLLSTGHSCRDRRIRRAAIKLLDSRAGREAHIGSTSAADVARFIMEVEEGVEGNWIPEWARARIIGIHVSREERVARLQC